MNTVYVMVPLLKIENKDDIETKAKQLLGMQQQRLYKNIQLHQINTNQYAIKINNFNLHFLQINHIIQEFNQAKAKIQLFQSILKDYQYQPYKYLIQSKFRSNQDIQGLNRLQGLQNGESILKKMKKYKQIKQQNKKLKKLLQLQLQNTQKVRQQTQKTMKVLRQQFDALVSQIGNKQKYTNSNYYQQSHNNNKNINNNADMESKQIRDKQRSQHGAKHTVIR